VATIDLMRAPGWRAASLLGCRQYGILFAEVVIVRSIKIRDWLNRIQRQG
jgi:hypothetical protein